MKIKTAKKNSDFEKINIFFGKMWLEEFNLERFDCIEQYKSGKVFFIEQEEKIISAIFIFERDGNYGIQRFGTLKEFRGKGFGRKVFDKMIKFLKDKKIKNLYVNADIKKQSMYEHLGFKSLGEIRMIGENKALKMLKII
ncbi:hypothetical protein DLH72_02905 [Candidatus Gracilibacteria bacterium]|nr:MAG: hypothetical protein DLH72_02905 [Candidatus Gracilibacteria bacterium]